MSFAHPENMQWLAVLPLLALLYIARVYIRKARIQKWLGARGALLSSSVSLNRRYAKMGLRLFALALLIIALARPQGPAQKTSAQSEGIYMLLLADVSASMLAEDIKPNRLAFMKREISRLIDMSSGDQIALAIFARSAFLAAPFTRDLSAVKSYLNDLSPGYISSQGTNFKRAFKFSARAFAKIKDKSGRRPVKALVIASDGEDHSKQEEKEIKELLAKQNVRVFAVSFGTKEGGVIPVRDYKNQIKEYKKDMAGELVVTRLDGKALKNFARWGKGGYYRASYGGKAIERLRRDLDRLEKAALKKTNRLKKREYYQWPLLLAFFIAWIELFIGDRAYKTGLGAERLKSRKAGAL